MIDLNNSHDGITLSDFNLAGAGHYDGAGNVLGQTATLAGAPGSYSGSTSYQYDGSDQLVNEQSGRLGTYNNVFAYDAAGNPRTWKGAAQTFNGDNQNNAGTFDLDGNPASWQGNTLTFDTASHLTGVGRTLTAGYNAEGLRAWKQNASGSTYFIYDGLTPIAEVDSHANVQAVNTWGANGLASRRTIATNSSVFYTFDVQGSTAQRLDSGGNVLGSYGFDAFGTRASTDNSTDPYCGFGAQFGYYRDAETGLSLLGERYYDPGQGRFLNRDPIGYAGGLNLYAYVGSNSMSFIDPGGYMGYIAPWQYPHEPSFGERLGDFLRAIFGDGTPPFTGTTGSGWEEPSDCPEDTSPTDNVGDPNLPGDGLSDPNDIKFSQDSASYRFKDGRSVDDLANGLRDGTIKPEDVPPIRLVYRNGEWYTLDNRRLEAFRRAGSMIQSRAATPDEIANEAWKFTTKNGGTSIRIRGGQ